MSQRKPIIGMLLETPYPPDIRVEKEARALALAGYKVHLLCVSDGKRPAHETIEALEVHRTIGYSGTLIRQLRLIETRWRFVAREWLKPLEAFIQHNGIDVLHVHDLPLVGTALTARERHPGLKVVSDLHENFAAGAAASVAYEKGFRGWLLNKLYAYPRWHAFEHRALKESDQVIAVVDEMKSRLIEQHKVGPDKITVISNYEDPEFLNLADEEIPKDPDLFTLSYIGGFSPARGLETAIRGMALLRNYPIRLQVVGKGTPVVEAAYRDLIAENGLHQTVELLGWQPFKRVPALMRAADVGVVPHARNEQTDNTIPHKLFQYMMIGLPLIVSTAKPLARIIKNHDTGEIFEAGSADSFAESVLRLFNDKARYAHCSQQGIKATLHGPLNWPSEGRRLAALYDHYPWTQEA